VPTQPPHHVSSFIFRISSLFRISSFGFRISQSLSRRAGDPSGRIIRNEPNSRIRSVPTTPEKAKQTQSTQAQDSIAQNEPNLPHPHRPGTPHFVKTNPIHTAERSEVPMHIGEPNFTPKKLATLAEGQSRLVGEPNLFTIHCSLFTAFYKTNPISNAADLWKTKICETNPIYRPITQLFTIHCSLFTIFTKRTQFTPPSTIHNIQYAICNPLAQFPTTNTLSTIYSMQPPAPT